MEKKLQEKDKERKPYKKPELSSEELFETDVLACNKRYSSAGCTTLWSATS